MKIEKIYKRDDKSQVKIEVRLFVDSYRKDQIEYRVEVYHKAPRKRTWVGFNTDDYTWRSIEFGSQERADYEHNWKLQYVTEDEILEAKTALWELIKP